MELAEESTSERQTENRFKLVLLGSADVGKSSLVLRYIRDDFMETVSTTGCAFFSHRVCLQGRILDFEIWDTAGQERYHSVSHLYYRGASAALLVYDITSKVAQAFAEQKGLLFIETSAKTGDGVKEVFEAVAHELLALEKQKEEKQRRRDSIITLEESLSSDVRHRCCNFH
ncbi:ras-related protein Rab-17 isoform X2 [Bufo bufo]|uniref:ras-related protein Rab-17 isoform X2 n=1 Tax=Bufo bufo TaxID=8384 RepID=UPI001ABDA412|nr:ras-related protein Rab-17 isoform X2 [Bufo bufo]